MKNGGSNPTLRVILSTILILTLLTTVILNALAGSAIQPFNNTVGNVSDVYDVCFTPAGYTFSIWSLIYIMLVFIAIYALTIPTRKGEDPDSYLSLPRLGGALPNSFLFIFIINLGLNVSWLFFWDRMNLMVSAIILISVAVTNLLAMVLMNWNFSSTADLLYQVHKVDFWLSIVCINGYALYATWTFLAANINSAIYLTHKLNLDGNIVCIGHLSGIFSVMILYAVLEATCCIRFFNVLFTHYFVYLWASVGIYMKQRDNPSTSTEVMALIITNMAVASALCLQRLVLITVRNCKKSYYTNGVSQES